MIFLELNYKFNNDEKKINIERKEFYNPKSVKYYLKDGDAIYVTNDQEVKVHQLLVKKTNGIKIFSPISGFVSIKGNSVIIANDNQDTALETEESVLMLEKISQADVLAACTKFGINVGNKSLLKELQENRKILFVNAIDCEPYLFNKKYLLKENCKNTLDIMTILANAFELTPYIVLSKYDTSNVDQIQGIIANYPNIRLIITKEVFPKNNSKFIIEKNLKEYSEKEILEIDIETIVKLFVALKEKEPYHEKMVTVMFNNPLRYFLVNTYYGVNLQEMIDSFMPASWGGKTVYLNNYYRKSKCVNFENLSLTDNVNTLFVFDDENEISTKCIKCGKCADICPVKINPLDKKLDASCIRCGLCNYICPANINLLVRVKDHE